MIPLILAVVVAVVLIALRYQSYQRSVNRLYGPKHKERIQRMNHYVRAQTRIKEWQEIKKKARRNA